jgi:hypothetical protein
VTKYENQSKYEVANVIKEWLVEEGLPVEDFEDENTDINYATKQGGVKINIGFHKRSKNSLIVMGGVHLETQEQEMFRYTKVKREFLYDIEMFFIQMNLDYVLSSSSKDGEFTVKDIKLQKTIYFDGLTKDRLFDIMSSIFNCLKLLKAKFLLLGKYKPESASH